MKYIILLISCLLCFLEVKGQVPDLPLSFTNEEVRRFKESVEVHCLSITTNELESARLDNRAFAGQGRILDINILHDASKINVEEGTVYIFKAEPPDIHHLEVKFESFRLSEASYMFIYNEFNDNQDNFFLVSNTNDDDFRDYGVPYTPYIGNRLVIELFEPHDNPTNSQVIITAIMQSL